MSAQWEIDGPDGKAMLIVDAKSDPDNANAPIIRVSGENKEQHAANIVRACNAHDDMVRELSASEKIILAMLNAMTLEQKAAVAAKLSTTGVSDDGMTRFWERRAALTKAGAA